MDPAFKRQLRMLMSHPVELGVHLAGPKLLARSEQGALGLRAVYGHTWGLDVELKVGRATEPAPRPYPPPAENGRQMVATYVEPPGRVPETMPGDPLEGLRFGLGWRPGAIRLGTLPPDPLHEPEEAGPWWYLSSMGGGAEHLGMDIALRVQPYPADGIVWLGWSWPGLGLPSGETMIAVPPLDDIARDAVILRARPDESEFPQDVRDHAARITEARQAHLRKRSPDG